MFRREPIVSLVTAMRGGGLAVALAILLAPSVGRAAGTFTPTVTETFTPSETLTHTISFTPSRSFTRTATQTRTRTFSPTVTPTYVVQIVIQNHAGEIVRKLHTSMPALPTIPYDVELKPNPFSPDCDGGNDTMFLVFPFPNSGVNIVAWDGRNERGHPVDNGRYLLDIRLWDTRGVLRGQYVKEAHVLARGNRIVARVYDEAGNLVREFPRLCMPSRLFDVELDPNPFAPGLDTGKNWRFLKIKMIGTNDLAPPTPAPLPNNNQTNWIYWLGDDTFGHLLPNGTYWLHVENLDPRGRKTVISKSVIVLRGKFDLLVDLLAYPNPHEPLDPDDMFFAYTQENASPVWVRVRIFDLQGRFIAERDSARYGEPDITGVLNRYRIRWRPLTKDKKHLADGIYTAEFSAVDEATRVREIKRIKFAIRKL